MSRAQIFAATSISLTTAALLHKINRLMDQSENGKQYLPTATLVTVQGTKKRCTKIQSLNIDGDRKSYDLLIVLIQVLITPTSNTLLENLYELNI
jgi:hypothetical protein